MSKAESQRVSYLDLPKKPQLAILCFARLIDPMLGSSINAYIYYQLQYLLPNATAPEIAMHAGYLVAGATASKVCTNVFLGRLADSPHIGRKMILLVGLLSCCLATLSYGMSTTFTAALLSQMFAGGMSSNVSTVRCIVAELCPEKKLRSRALLLIAACGNVGQFIGPLLGGLLSSTQSKPGEGLMKANPFLLPNLVIAGFFAIAVLGVALFLEETLEQPSGGRKPLNFLWTNVKGTLLWSKSDKHNYSPIPDDANPLMPIDDSGTFEASEPVQQKIAFREIWTSQVICTMIAQFIIAGHITSFQLLWATFLSTPVDKSSQTHQSIIRFGGGVGLTPPVIGSVMSTLNGVSVILQLFIYPKLSDRWGTLRLWRAALIVFPFTYLFAPSPAFVASKLTSNTSVAVWIAIAGVLILNVTGRTAALPAMTILINDCVPGPSARATINAAGTSTAQLSKCIFPFVILSVYAWGLQKDIVGLAFWLLGGLALVAIIASRWVKTSDIPTKNEIRLHVGDARA